MDKNWLMDVEPGDCYRELLDSVVSLNARTITNKGAFQRSILYKISEHESHTTLCDHHELAFASADEANTLISIDDREILQNL